jgi:hypothetical protein
VGEDNHFICKCKACGHEYEYTVDWLRMFD